MYLSANPLSKHIDKKDLTALLIVMGFVKTKIKTTYGDHFKMSYIRGNTAISMEQFAGLTIANTQSQRGRSFSRLINGFDRLGILEYINEQEKE